MTTDEFDDDDLYCAHREKRKPSKWGRRFTVQGDSEHIYTVSRATYGKMSPTGEWGCSCPAWKFQRKVCKHIERVATFWDRLERLGEEYVVDVEVFIDGMCRFKESGKMAIWRIEKLLGASESDWIITDMYPSMNPIPYPPRIHYRLATGIESQTKERAQTRQQNPMRLIVTYRT